MDDVVFDHLIANAVVLAAAAVQTATGVGFAMIAAPLLALISLDYVPGPMLCANLLLALVMLRGGRAQIARREIATLCPAIVVGAVVGALVAARLAGPSLAVLVAVVILLAVALSCVARPLALSLRNLSVCGVAVGAMGATSGVPGPPLVILYQHQPLEKARPTLALVFSFAYAASLAALAQADAFGAAQIADAARLTPGVLAGYLVGRGLGRRLSARAGRAAMLLIASIGALTLLAANV